MLRTSIDKIKENVLKLTKERNRRYPAKTITDTDYADDTSLLANASARAETLLHSLERTAAGIGLHVNAHKTEYMCFNQTGDISTTNGSSLKLVDKFTYLGSSVSSTDTDMNTRLAKAWTANNRLSVIWKSDLTDKMKRSYFTTWTLTNIWRKSLTATTQECCEQYWTSPGGSTPQTAAVRPLTPITKTIRIRRTRHAGHCWRRRRGELISDVLMWTPSLGRTKAGRPARTYIEQLCADKGCSPEDLPEAMDDREWWRES